jgi:two-component system, NarL family, nitrate/nitrite response regulator NarL
MTISLEVAGESGASAPRLLDISPRSNVTFRPPARARDAAKALSTRGLTAVGQVAQSSVVVVDSHPLFREAIAQTLRADGAFEIIGEGACADDALRLAKTIRPSILVMDLSCATGDAVALAALVASLAPARVLVMSTDEDQQTIADAFRCGVLGYLLKGTNGQELVEGVRLVAQGKRCVSHQLVGKVLAWLSDQNTVSTSINCRDIAFTEREEQVLCLLSIGRSNKQIAYELGLSEKTVKYYVTHILRKLQVDNRVEAALFASRRTPVAA